MRAAARPTGRQTWDVWQHSPGTGAAVQPKHPVRHELAWWLTAVIARQAAVCRLLLLFSG